MMESSPTENDSLLNKSDDGISSSMRLSQRTVESFAELRILNSDNEDDDDAVSLFDDVQPRNMNTFWEDVKTFEPGSIPHSTVLAIVIGCVCGVVAYVYYHVLEFLLEFLWRDLPEKCIVGIFPEWLYWLWIPLVGSLMALGVGFSVKYFGEPGDLSYTVQCVHDKAFIDMSHVFPMLCASQFSILGGGSLGPEAPLVAICAAFAGFISRKIFLNTRMNLVRKHTLMGMACALAAFFGVPLGGSLFALEINNRFGIEYYEHTMTAIFAGTVCLCVFRGLAGMELGAIWVIEEVPLPNTTYDMVLVGALLGSVGAGIAAVFAAFHKRVMGEFKERGLLEPDRIVDRALTGASVILTLGVIAPRTMFWGEEEFQTLATGAHASNLPHVFPTAGLLGLEMSNVYTAVLVGVMKLIAISFTVAGGYRGGFIFPFFAAGACFGKGLTYLFPELPTTLATLAIAAGINVSITRTGLATPLILTALSGEPNAGPPLLAASMVALFATSYMPFIRGQKVRDDLDFTRHAYEITLSSGRVLTGPQSKKRRDKLPTSETDDSENQLQRSHSDRSLGENLFKMMKGNKPQEERA